MRTLPPMMPHLLAPFAPCFSRRVWGPAVELMVGALLTPGKCTVTAALRVLGLAQHPRFERHHRVLNRATWSGLAVSRSLLGLLVTAFVPDGPLIIRSDETRERHHDAKHPHAGSRATGVYRAPVHFSRIQFVTSLGCAGSV